jgi:alkylation response protein AidB-like acyl-CoA dehydrogenase
LPTGHADDHDIQIRLAMAEASLRASRTFVLDVTEEVFTEARAGNPMAHDLQTAYTLATQLAVSSAVDAVNVAFDVAGASALAADRIQRCWRDVNVVSQHCLFARKQWRGAGEALLRPPVPM